MLIWIDETGSSRRNSIREYGYANRGVQPGVFKLRVGGKRISAIPVMTTRGIEVEHANVCYQYSYRLMVTTHGLWL